MKLVHTFVGLLCAFCSALSVAAEPVQEAEYLDGNGNRVSVISLDDGSLRVMTNDEVFVGTEAITALSARGIVLEVNPSGHIMGHTLAAQVTATIKPRSVTKGATNNTRNVTVIQTDALPSNVSTGTAVGTQSYYESAMQRSTGSDTPSRDPVSAR